MEEYKVSIITPMYNSAKFLCATIDSVLQQTYQNWELLFVDDCSTDDSAAIVQAAAAQDSRIRLLTLETNGGAAVARNHALAQASGRFVAYLDADDLWKRKKTEKQVQFMLANKIAFSCTSYEVIDENGNAKNKLVSMPAKINYNQFLRNTIIQTVGVMIDTELTGKDLISMPLLRRRQDAAAWCKLLKNGFLCHGLPESLAYYRRVSDSLSSNKFRAVQGTWYLFRVIEKLPLARACFCFVGYAFNACRKRIYISLRRKGS